MPDRQCQPAFQGAPPQRTVSVGLHLRFRLEGLAVRGVRCGHVRQAHHGLVDQMQHVERLRVECPGASSVRTPISGKCLAHHYDKAVCRAASDAPV